MRPLQKRLKLVASASRVSGHLTEPLSGSTHQLHSKSPSTVPVVVKSEDLGTGEPVVVQQSPESGGDLGFLRRRDFTRWIGWVRVLGLVLHIEVRSVS